MAAVRVVPAFDEPEDGELGFGLGAEPASIEQLTLEGREEAFRHRVVIAVPDGPARRTHADFRAALSEPQRRVLTPVVGMVNDAGRLSLIVRHLERVEDEGGLEMCRHCPADNATTEGI